MVSTLFFSQLVLVALVWLCVMLHWTWPSDPAAVCPTTPEPQAHGQSATVSPHPLKASPPSRTAMPVRTALPLARKLPHLPHPASCPHGGAVAKWIPPRIAAPTRTVLLAAG